MADLTAGGVPVYRDSAGVLREKPEAAPSTPTASTNMAVQSTKGFVQITSAELSEVRRLTPPAGTTRALVQNSGGSAARYRSDGTAPTTAVGMTLDVGDALSFWGEDVARVAFIDTGANAVLDVTFYG